MQSDRHYLWRRTAIAESKVVAYFLNEELRDRAAAGHIDDPTFWLRGIPYRLPQFSDPPPDCFIDILLEGSPERWPPGCYHTDASGGPLTA